MNDLELERIYDAHASDLFHYLVTFTKTEADARDQPSFPRPPVRPPARSTAFTRKAIS